MVIVKFFMKKKITINEIAKNLGVSKSTVSKALRNRKEIGPDTTRKIQEYAKLLNYRPNSIAVSLKDKRTKNIGVIIPEIVHHFFTTVIRGIEDVANEKDYNVIVCLSDESFKKEVINMEMLANGSIDGFIVAVAKGTLKISDFHHFNEVINQGMPLVLFDRVVDEVNCDKVIVDDTNGSYKAVKHLIDSGCKRVAIITTVDYINVGKLRTDGYINALISAGMEIDSDLILKIEDLENSEVQIAKLISDDSIDGIFSVNELFAVTAMKYAIKNGRKIPEDISFIAFTDGILSKCAIPALSTIAQHGIQMGRISAELLISKLEENEEVEEEFNTHIVKTSIIERETTKKPHLAKTLKK